MNSGETGIAIKRNRYYILAVVVGCLVLAGCAVITAPYRVTKKTVIVTEKTVKTGVSAARGTYRFAAMVATGTAVLT